MIGTGVLRLTRLRPNLVDANRSAVLSVLGLTPELRVFTDFIESASAVSLFPGSLERSYAPQVQELYGRFGLKLPLPRTLRESDGRVRELAAAVIEVSWQFAVAGADPTCDLALQGPIELHLAEEIVHEGVGGGLGAGRHFARLDLGQVPNLDSTRLSVADALAIRSEDSFEQFRYVVRQALDRLELEERSGIEPSRSRGAFEEAMQEGARSLREYAKRATFSDRVKEMSIPAALGVVAEVAAAPHGVVPAATTAGALSAATVVWQWLLARRNRPENTTAYRYLSMLGGIELHS